MTVHPRPCPWCNNRPHVGKAGTRMWYIGCVAGKCPVQLRIRPQPRRRDAVEAWNMVTDVAYVGWTYDAKRGAAP